MTSLARFARCRARSDWRWSCLAPLINAKPVCCSSTARLANVVLSRWNSAFVEAFAIDSAAALTVALIPQLYQVERAAAELTPDARRALRRRKNWLFAGSMAGARRAALLYSLVQSCKLVDAPPFAYLKDVLLRLATHPHRFIDQITPKGWARTFGAHPSA